MASLDLLPHFDSIKDALDYLDTSALRLMASKYFTYAFFTLLIYDHLLTLEEEVRIIWLGRPSFVKFLFLWNRYTSPLFIAIDIATLSGSFKLSDRFCKTWLSADVIFELVALVTTTLIITYRIHAVLGNLRVMYPVLFSVWTAQALVSVALVITLVTVKTTPSVAVEPIFKVCMADLHTHKVWTIWIPSMVFHTFVFALLVYKAICTPRDAKTPMLMLLIRDGILYFTVVFLAFLFNLLVWALAPVSLAILPHDSVWAICTMALSHLMLSMDSLYSNGAVVHVTTEEHTTTNAIGSYNHFGQTTTQNGTNSNIMVGAVPAYQRYSNITIPVEIRKTLEEKRTVGNRESALLDLPQRAFGFGISRDPSPMGVRSDTPDSIFSGGGGVQPASVMGTQGSDGRASASSNRREGEGGRSSPGSTRGHGRKASIDQVSLHRGPSPMLKGHAHARSLSTSQQPFFVLGTTVQPLLPSASSHLRSQSQGSGSWTRSAFKDEEEGILGPVQRRGSVSSANFMFGDGIAYVRPLPPIPMTKPPPRRGSFIPPEEGLQLPSSSSSSVQGINNNNVMIGRRTSATVEGSSEVHELRLLPARPSP